MRTSRRLRHRPELTESLASVIDHLRAWAGDKSHPELRPALLGSADVFLDRLASHIAEEASSDTTPRFMTLKSDHETLNSAARHLVIRILKGDDMIDAARVLLVRLLQHIRSEDDGTSRSLDLLGVRGRMPLARRVLMRRERLTERRNGE